MLIRSKENIVAQLAGTKSFLCNKRGTKEPIVNESGESQWQFNIMVPGKYRFEQIAIKTFSESDPIQGADMGDSVELGSVEVQIGHLSNEDGKRIQFWTVSADSVALKKAKA